MEPLGERPELEAQSGKPPQSPAVVPLNLSSHYFRDGLSPLYELCPRLDSENTGSDIVLTVLALGKLIVWWKSDFDAYKGYFFFLKA